MTATKVVGNGLILFACAWSCFAVAFDVAFVDVADSHGLTHVGTSFGASWGDFNDDGNPDLFFSNHLAQTAIYRNDDFEFTDVSSTVAGSLTGDLHAGAWGDFDNDGDQDLAIAAGAAFGLGSDNNRILETRTFGFLERAESLGASLPLGRGRTPLWFDWNNDGQLDLLFTNVRRNDGLAPTTLFTRTLTGFENANSSVGLMPNGYSNFSIIAAQNSTSPALLLIQSNWPFPGALYNYADAPFLDVQNSAGPMGIPAPIHDITVGDFDNDLQTEMYLTRIAKPMLIRAITPQQIRAHLIGDAAENYGFSFSAIGSVAFSTGTISSIAPSHIRIGASGLIPSPFSLDFKLDPSDKANWGEFEGNPTTPGLFIHYDPTSKQWFVQLRDNRVVGVLADSANPIKNVQSINIPIESSKQLPVYLDQSDGRFVTATAAAGLATPRSCQYAANADFDNDMDLDIYLACSDTVGNLTNQLLENNGQGLFTLVTDAAGATGPIEGSGGAIALADFDSDGFIDILVTNGAGGRPFSTDGPTQLYKNLGNDNHWLQIKLRGVESNRDGVGTSVVVHSNGMQQYRLQNGGMHWHAQDHSRLHFGLGKNQTIDRIELKWPSGIVQVLEDVAVDQVLNITEASMLDSDGDSILDTVDNCLQVANVDQTDSNSDGFGNACDADTNNDCIVNFQDVAAFAGVFLSSDIDNDFNDDSVVNFLDLSILASAFLQTPGPSAVAICSLEAL